MQFLKQTKEYNNVSNSSLSPKPFTYNGE